MPGTKGHGTKSYWYNFMSINPYTTATNNIGQKYNGPEYQYQ